MFITIFSKFFDVEAYIVIKNGLASLLMIYQRDSR